MYTIDDDCFVAKDPTGEQVNALAQHIKNLTSPSTPFFFNTLYDPYAEVSAGIWQMSQEPLLDVRPVTWSRLAGACDDCELCSSLGHRLRAWLPVQPARGRAHRCVAR